MVKVKEDLTGKTFGKLTVLRQADDYVSPNGRHAARWLCKCSCEESREVLVKGSDLKSNRTQSCGCLHKEYLISFNGQSKKKYNEYSYEKEYGVGYCSNTGSEFYFDWADFEIIKQYCWNEHVKHTGYHVLEAYDKESDQVVVMMHVLGCKGYDHKDRNPLNNRRNNLRPATQKENVRNKSKQRNNNSGVTGVGYLKSRNKWRARITTDDKEIHLGLFIDKEDAIRARLQAEVLYFGDFAPQKHLFEKYNIVTEV